MTQTCFSHSTLVGPETERYIALTTSYYLNTFNICYVEQLWKHTQLATISNLTFSTKNNQTIKGLSVCLKILDTTSHDNFMENNYTLLYLIYFFIYYISLYNRQSPYYICRKPQYSTLSEADPFVIKIKGLSAATTTPKARITSDDWVSCQTVRCSNPVETTDPP